MIFSWVLFFTVSASYAVAAPQPLGFACSAQVYEALGAEVIAAFTAETDIKVDLYVSSSQTAVSRVENNFAALATSTTRLYRQQVTRSK
jgi:ABC-type molybdate transport system substrate-binding protein